MERRQILTTSGTILVGLAAGCSQFDNDSRNEEYAYGVSNYSDEDHSFKVQIQNTSSGIIHTEIIQLTAGTAIEPDTKDEITFKSDPVRILIQVDSSEERDIPWPASSSAEGEIAKNAQIAYDQENEKEVSVFG